MTECFDCDNCKESLYGRKYIQMDNGPYCIPCYDAHFANTCDECKELIGHDCRVSMGPRGRAGRSPGAMGPLLISAVFPRSCTTRIAITTSTAFVASAVTVLWLTSRSPAKARSCCATTATAASFPPNALPARRQSCQVGAGRLEHCGLFLVPAAASRAAGSDTRAAGERAEFLLSCPAVTAPSGLGPLLVWQDSRIPSCGHHSSPVCLFPFFMGK